MDENLKEQVERLEEELKSLKEDRFRDLSTNDVEKLKGYIFERTATNVSGAADGALITTLNGRRHAIATSSNFPPTP